MLAQDNFAVMLNANARRVSSSVRRKIERIVPPENIYYSSTQAESADITREIANIGYPVVFTGGGDGTFVKFVNDYASAPAPLPFSLPALPMDSAVSSLPDIGVLHLGTGNAVASIVSSGNFECDLQSYVNSGYKDSQLLNLVEADGVRFPFAGMGWDGELLNDYNSIKNGIGSNRMLKPLLQNMGGYFAALFTRTMPRHLMQLLRGQSRPEVRITNLGEEAHVLHRGRIVRTYGPGEVLYEGPQNVTLFGTLPYYGHGMTVLPYAMTRPGFFNLRVCTMSLPQVLTRLRKVWNGTYEGPDMFDWHCTHARLEFSRPMPFQIGGDAQGWKESVDLRISPLEVNLLRFI